MVKVKNIQGSPEITPDEYYSIHSDDNYFYFFDSEKEHNDFIEKIPTDDSWKKESIEQEAEFLFDKALEKYWYSRFDVLLYAEKGEQNALKVVQYYELLWRTIEMNFSIGNYDFKLPTIN